MAPVRIRIRSKSVNFKCDRVFHVDDTSMSWAAFLHQQGMELSYECDYWIRNINNNNSIAAIPDEPIQEFLGQYHCKMDMHSVRITAPDCRTKEQYLQRKMEFNLRKDPAMASRRQEAQIQPSYSTANKTAKRQARACGNESGGPKRARLHWQGRTYPEDDFENVAMNQNADRFEDNASMLSEGSQNDQEGGSLVKQKIVRRLQGQVSNTDLALLINEHKEMKRRGKMMKVARYLPLIMNFLNVLLEQ